MGIENCRPDRSRKETVRIISAEETGEGFAILIRVEMPGQHPTHTQRIGLETGFAIIRNITAPRGRTVTPAHGAKLWDKEICYAGYEQTYR